MAKQLLTQAGFKVDMQAMDFKTLVSRRSKKDGWNIFLTFSASVTAMNPVSNNWLSAVGYPGAQIGWPSDPKLESLHNAFANAQTDVERKRLAEEIQVRAMEIGAFVPLGNYLVKVGARKTVTGFVTGFFTVYWNVEKKS